MYLRLGRARCVVGRAPLPLFRRAPRKGREAGFRGRGPSAVHEVRPFNSVPATPVHYWAPGMPSNEFLENSQEIFVSTWL